MEKPKQYCLAFGSSLIDKIVDTAVGLLASFKTISRRDVAITHIKPRREFLAFTHVSKFFIYSKNIHSSELIAIGNLKLAERPVPVFVKRNISEVFILLWGMNRFRVPSGFLRGSISQINSKS
jgi:hypothetical protein